MTSKRKQKLVLIFQGGKWGHPGRLRRSPGMKIFALFTYAASNTGTVQQQKQ